MRHAKSDWHSGTERDFDRVLNKRGRRAAGEMGLELKNMAAPPDRVVCSPALRARQTVERVFLKTGWRLDRLEFDESLYLASCDELIEVLRRFNDLDIVMVVGHNPGLEELMVYLCGSDIERTRKGKLLTTANIATIDLGPDGLDIGEEAKLVELIRPH
ncbi:MAG: phosphoglycerate mutase [marine bacterium B5-7]|nr:MAG: phosphoglycerate mutase [marine bacterium B5-7]